MGTRGSGALAWRNPPASGSRLVGFGRRKPGVWIFTPVFLAGVSGVFIFAPSSSFSRFTSPAGPWGCRSGLSVSIETRSRGVRCHVVILPTEQPGRPPGSQGGGVAMGVYVACTLSILRARRPRPVPSGRGWPPSPDCDPVAVRVPGCLLAPPRAGLLRWGQGMEVRFESRSE